MRIVLTVAIAASVLAGCGGTAVSGPIGVSSPSHGAVPVTTPRPTALASRAPSASAAFLYDPAADAKANLDAAFAAAKKSGKRVLIDYGADWCPDCHSLAAYFDGPAGRALIHANFEVVKVDVGYWDRNLDVAKRYGDAIANGIPAVVVYRADGSPVGSTADGSLANARAMTEAQVLAKLTAWTK